MIDLEYYKTVLETQNNAEVLKEELQMIVKEYEESVREAENLMKLHSVQGSPLDYIRDGRLSFIKGMQTILNIFKKAVEK